MHGALQPRRWFTGLGIHCSRLLPGLLFIWKSALYKKWERKEIKVRKITNDIFLPLCILYFNINVILEMNVVMQKLLTISNNYRKRQLICIWLDRARQVRTTDITVYSNACVKTILALYWLVVVWLGSVVYDRLYIALTNNSLIKGIMQVSFDADQQFRRISFCSKSVCP